MSVSIVGEVPPSLGQARNFEPETISCIFLRAFMNHELLTCLLPRSSPFSKDDKHRVKHINMLQKLLNNPTIITSSQLVNEFEGTDDLQVGTFERIDDQEICLLPARQKYRFVLFQTPKEATQQSSC